KFLTEDEIAAIRKATNLEEGDVLFIVADANKTVFASLGALRLKLAEKLDLIPKDKYNLLWVTEFPQFEWSEEEGRYMAMHHPFTSPMDDDLDRLESDPANVRAKAYDIVLNGVEIGGGSIRIHSMELQKRMFRALGFTDEQAEYRFGFLTDAFRYGPPPHGGMAYGLDRLAMIITGSTSIRDVIAFPKVQNASCPMTGAPDFVDDKQLAELHIACTEKEE
ncbi:MAG: amino acid--tRNA ligase-related protein, partial [Clostridiaceae bacterium]